MDTGQLAVILQDQAIGKEKAMMDKVIDQCMSGLRLSGTSFIVNTTRVGTDEEVAVDVYKFFQAFKIQLLAKRDQSIRTDAIRDFLNKFESFQSHMLTIEQYAQDMVEGQ